MVEKAQGAALVWASCEIQSRKSRMSSASFFIYLFIFLLAGPAPFLLSSEGAFHAVLIHVTLRASVEPFSLSDSLLLPQRGVDAALQLLLTLELLTQLLMPGSQAKHRHAGE